MAWMRIMGADSVDYHRATVLARGDDHPGQALAYYASRGETPLLWGGAGARLLGLQGAVTDEQYAALYGAGGACDPTTGERLVNTKRPGLELVISAHKSVAELGVIGRAEDMHRIMDAERDATLAYLDDLTRRLGGRRGEAAVRTPTEGLIYATARHATSRAGDPGPHDHVLLANLLRMNDDKGGWKAAVTALWTEHLHAATMVGRMASARVAVELGYGIVADDGPSGKLGHWAIAGVPEAVMDIHSKRAAEIEAELQRTGNESYQARNVAARATRGPKRHQPVGELMPRWVAEIGEVGWSVEAVAQAVDRDAVEHLDVQAWVTAVAAAGAGPDTTRGAFRALHEVVSLALRSRIIGHDPCLGVKLPKVDRREMLFLSPAQVTLLADSIEGTWPGHGWGLLVRFTAYSGCRAGEVGGLRVKHLDLLRHRAKIVVARKTYGADGATKTGKARWVDLPRQLCDELAAHLAARDHEPEARVWTGERGGPLAHKWFYTHRFKPVVDELSDRGLLPTIEIPAAGVDVDTFTLRFHDLRHTCVALLIAKGAQQYEVMEHLGHTNIQTTINTYGHLFPNVRERIRVALEDTWDEGHRSAG